jgi:hypothetical protein
MSRLKSLGWLVSSAALLPACLLAQEPLRSPHGSLSLDCSVCHQADKWVPARVSRQFDHSRLGFALTGAHGSASCRACHATLDFKGATTECVGCHEDIHRGEFGQDCARCHTPRSFLDRAAMSRLHQSTRFPLAGAHLAADCQACHTGAAQGQLQFVNRSSDCVDCHRSSYQTAKDPDHVAGGFPTDCSQCHAVTLWQRARFNHDATVFPLTGAHRAIACNKCHLNNKFSGTATTCVGCHQQDYTATTAPSHSAAHFPTDCSTCHSTTAWTGAFFDHSQTQFPLTGAHKTLACDQCHGSGVYQGLTTACSGCHQQDYARTTNPNHQAAQFPTDCTSCHTTTAWTGATFDHDGPFFPIYSGTHRGTWSSCATCHTVATDFSQFTCLQCHEHAQAQMDSRHSQVRGYSYNSQACLSCHPTGRGD